MSIFGNTGNTNNWNVLGTTPSSGIRCSNNTIKYRKSFNRYTW